MNNRRHLNAAVPILGNMLLYAHIRRNGMRIKRRLLRDAQDPFDVPEAEFVRTYRLTQELAITLINEISPHMAQGERNTFIPNFLKVLVTLKFLASGSYQHGIGLAAHTSMSQTSCSRAIRLVCRMITNVMLPNWVEFPTTNEQMLLVKQGFYTKFGFRGVVGCIDGTHVEIVAPYSTDPDHPPHVYINRKGVHSINVMLICDSDCHILACDARFPGSVHDAAIWSTSDIRAFAKRLYETGDHSFHLLGDSGYGLEPWLFVPIIARVQEGGPEARFNEDLRSARNTIERTNGILKGRFRCLLRHRVLHYNPENAAYIIYAACVLHNMAVLANLNLNEEDIFIEDEDDEDEHNLPMGTTDMVNDNILNLGRTARDNYIRQNYN